MVLEMGWSGVQVCLWSSTKRAPSNQLPALATTMPSSVLHSWRKWYEPAISALSWVYICPVAAINSSLVTGKLLSVYSYLIFTSRSVQEIAVASSNAVPNRCMGFLWFILFMVFTD